VRMALLAAGADKSSRMDAMAADEGETPWRRGRFNTGAREGHLFRGQSSVDDHERSTETRSPPTSPSRKSGGRSRRRFCSVTTGGGREVCPSRMIPEWAARLQIQPISG
jgi:hypothetical protein